MPAFSDELLLDESKDLNITTASFKAGEKPTLHEILMAEKLDFEAKVQRAAKRKKWLKGSSKFKFLKANKMKIII